LQERQREASIRNMAWAAFSPKDQLASLDKRLGKGIGAKKQRNKLEKANV
jgi:hypothetical protein